MPSIFYPGPLITGNFAAGPYDFEKVLLMANGQ